MKFAVLADERSFGELIQQGHSDISWVRVQDVRALFDTTDADAFFNLTNDHPFFKQMTQPYFMNSVCDTLSELSAPENTIRINGWTGFLSMPVWEISGILHEKAEAVLQRLNKKYIVVKDEPGFITARIISMIINEAYYATDEAVSAAPQIDIAMKLGTNYPYGPFEWAEKIGIDKIVALLTKLSLTDARYDPAPSLALNYPA